MLALALSLSLSLSLSLTHILNPLYSIEYVRSLITETRRLNEFLSNQLEPMQLFFL